MDINIVLINEQMFYILYLQRNSIKKAKDIFKEYKTFKKWYKILVSFYVFPKKHVCRHDFLLNVQRSAVSNSKNFFLCRSFYSLFWYFYQTAWDQLHLTVIFPESKHSKLWNNFKDKCKWSNKKFLKHCTDLLMFSCIHNKSSKMFIDEN